MLIAAVLLLPLRATAQADSTLVRKGWELAAKGKCKDAQRLVAPLLDREPPSASALVLRANCRLQRSETVGDGMADLQRALEIEPDNFNALMYRGSVFERRGMYQRAEEDLNGAVEHADDTTSTIHALNRRCWVRIQQRKFHPAKQDAEQVLTLDSLNKTAYNNLGIIYSDLGDTATSFAMLRKFLELAPDDDVALSNTGYFLAEAGHYEEALRYFDQAAARGRADAQFYNNRGFARLGAGDLKGARKDIERSIDMDASNSYAFRNLARLCFAEGRTKDGCLALEKALMLGFTKQYGNEVDELRRTKCH